MKTPNLRLMRMYGNEQAFFQKTAAPLETRRAILAAVRDEMERVSELRTTGQQVLAQRINAQHRLEYLADLERAIIHAHHARAPMMVRDMSRMYGTDPADLPVGMTEGMIRMASAIGQDMAKTASNNPNAGAPYRQPSISPVPPAPNPAAAAAEGVSPAAQAVEGVAHHGKNLMKRLGLHGKTLGMRNWLLKPALLGGAALATAGGLKLLKGGLDFLGTEAGTPSYNQGGYQLAPDVNQYGQAQMRLPAAYY